MCSLPAAMLTLQVAQTAMSAAQSNTEAKAQAKSYRRAAELARTEADQQAATDREKAERLRATLRTGYARAGVVPEGSPAEALTSLAADQEDEIQRQLTHGYAQADDLDSRASLARSRGRYALLNGVLQSGVAFTDSVANGLFKEVETPKRPAGSERRILLARGGDLA